MKHNSIYLSLATVLVSALLGAVPTPTAWADRAAIVNPASASPLERFAAREVRRYVYLRTGELLPIVPSLDQAKGAAIVVARRDRPVVAGVASETVERITVDALKPERYWLKSKLASRPPVLLVTGGDDVGTLYAAYRLAEHLGVRFYLHGDVLPDERQPLQLPELDERGAPLFALRGIQPFHDFPEGPDWWNRDDYLAILSQLPKLRMNFFGLHTYPEGGPNAEPTVWIGLAGDIADGSRVKSSYPASYQNSLRGNWGYAPRKTGDYIFGASELFERDDFGSDVMWGQSPEPRTAEGCNEVFQRTADLLRAAFEHARQLGVKTCVGTETALTVPKAVQERLRSMGKNPADLATVQELYAGMFRRAVQAYPLDYYWFWTPEGWTWEGTKDEQVKRTIDDLLAGVAAAKEVGVPFQLATCGWVLGPQQDRALFDRVLPKTVAVSCINREVGRTPVDKGFADVSGRGKWAIPWLEDDPALTSPQLWVGRMRRDAADARRYGCDGLMGIHWRTRVLGPAVAALAQAAWAQAAWAPSMTLPPTQLGRVPGPAGGQIAHFPNHTIAGTADASLYQSVRYNLAGYHLPVPNGSYRVTLKFCEPHYTGPGRRVFQVHVQGQRVIERLDIFEKVGQDRAFDVTCDKVAVSDGWLNVEFLPLIEFPSIAALVVEGPNFSQKINCGGPAYQDYVADSQVAPVPPPTYPATADFYQDWAQHEFGPAIAGPAAALFGRLDGQLPRPSDWVDGPGGIRPDPRPWDQVQRDYAFVDEFAALAPQVRGAGCRDRFHYWWDTFRYLRAMAQVNCTWAEYNTAFAKVKAESDAGRKKQLATETCLPLRKQLVAHVGELYRHLLALVSNPGELGTVMNWEAHNLPGLLSKPGEELAQVLGEPLPADTQPTQAYQGPMRLIVPTLRPNAKADEEINVKVILLGEQAPKDAALYWRPLGRGKFTRVPLERVDRGVHRARFTFPAEADRDVEYYVKAVSAAGAPVFFPATAPKLNQTIVQAP